MPQNKKPGAAPWSYSRLKNFETCPRQYQHLKVLKDFIEPESDAMRYGNEFHKACEDFIASDAPLPPKFKFAEKFMQRIAKMRGKKLPEQKYGVTRDHKPCGFFDNRKVWYRGIADLVVINGKKAKVGDYKTGRNTKYADVGQLELMALSVFAHQPEIEEVDAALLFPIAREKIGRTYTRDDIEHLWEKWEKKFERMEKAHETGVFNAKPSGLCKKHCIVVSCEHNGANNW